MFRRLIGALVAVMLVNAPLLAKQPPAAQDGFVPIDQLPPREQLPAAPLLITAYVVVWLLLMFYLWTIARRLGRVEREMQALERRTSRDLTL